MATAIFSALRGSRLSAGPNVPSAMEFRVLDRTSLTTSKDEEAAELSRVVCLMQTVFRKPEFSRRMAEASLQGLNWIEALEHVAKGSSGECSSEVS